MTTTTAQLMEQGILHEHAVKSMRTYDSILAGDRSPTEANVTAFLADLGGAAERAFIGVVCRTAKIEYRPGLRVIPGSQYRMESGSNDKRTIDLPLIDVEQDRALAGAVEAKFKAAMNGYIGYCPRNPYLYSSQGVCYAHGCISENLNSDSVPLVWLSLPISPEDEPWGSRGVNDNNRGASWYDESRSLQRNAGEGWGRLGWSEVWTELGAVPGVTNAVLRACGYTSERMNARVPKPSRAMRLSRQF